jgi:acetylornithine deacetylase/succinyl-diaminopimelate desuccinylase-like protein
MDVTAEELAESVATLVRIPSVNPLQAGPIAESAGPIGERTIAEHLAERFHAVGADEVVLDEAARGRPNVYAWFPGRNERLVVLDVHTDTVTVEHMTDPPFDGRIEDDHVWGRGALDTKASLGAILALLARWHHDGARPEPTLLVVGSIGEEAGGLVGATRFRPWAEDRGLAIDEMIVAEPTRLAPIHGHKGGVALRVTVHGKAAHSALPDLGENAIEAMAPVIAAYRDEHVRLQTVTPTTELGTSTVSVTRIEGGTGGNVIPAECSITVGQRTVPEQVAHEAFERLVAIANEACPLPVTCESVLPAQPDGTFGSDAFYQPADSGLVRSLAEWAGTDPAVAPFGTNALRYGGLARELAVFGPGSIDDAHQATERVAIADLVTTAEVYTRWLRPG